MNIAWYARDSYLDLYVLLSRKLKDLGVLFSPFYVCHIEAEAARLRADYGIMDADILAQHLETHDREYEASDRIIRRFEAQYDSIPLVRALWSEIFELNVPEPLLVKHMIGHFRFWERFLSEYSIDVLITERPSIMTTCVAWLVCKKLGIKFVSFVSVPIGNRLVFSSSWPGNFDGLDEIFSDYVSDRDSANYRIASEYLEKMKNRPEKPGYAVSNTNASNVLKKIDSVEKLKDVIGKLCWYHKMTDYYVHKPVSSFLMNWFRISCNLLAHKCINMFDHNFIPDKERYFLFPLHSLSEKSAYSYLGYGYSDQLSIVRQISNCIPPGAWLYVKEHTGMFGEKNISFYRQIKACRQVRLISPRENSFYLLQKAEAVITLGSTMGFEAVLMDKPVILLGDVWYKNFPGVYQSDSIEQTAILMQNASNISVPIDERKHRMINAVLDISFKGVIQPKWGGLEPDNISRLATALKRQIENA